MAVGNILIRRLIDELAEDGRRAIQTAYENRDFTNRTYNLHDSYGSAVYYNGVLQEASKHYITPSAEKSKRWRGRWIRGHDELIDFLHEYNARKKGLDLVIVAAMPYASYLEDGAGKLKRKYRVISGAWSQMQSLQSKYKGAIVRRESTGGEYGQG